MEQKLATAALGSLHGDRAHAALRILGAPRQYLRPWYGAYLLRGMVIAGLLPVLIPLMVEALSHRLDAVAYVAGAYDLGVLTSPLYGILAERFHRYRRLFLGAFLITALAIAALPMARGLPGWMLAAFVIGTGSGCAATLATLFVVDFEPRAQWGRRIGWLKSFSASGQVVGLLLASMFSDGSWTVGLWVAAGLLLLALPIGGLGLPVMRKAHLSGARRHHAPARLDLHSLAAFPRFSFASAIDAHLFPLNRLELRELLRLARFMNTAFGRFLLSWFMLVFAGAAFISYFPLMLAQAYGIPAHTSARVFAAAAAVCIGLYVVVGRLASRYSATALYRAGATIEIVGFVLLLSPLVGPTTAMARSLIGLTGFVLIVIALPPLSVSAADLAASLTPFSKGAAVGLLHTASALAGAIGTLVSGSLIHRWGYEIIPIMALGGLAVSMLLELGRRRRRPPLTEQV